MTYKLKPTIVMQKKFCANLSSVQFPYNAEPSAQIPPPIPRSRIQIRPLFFVLLIKKVKDANANTYSCTCHQKHCCNHSCFHLFFSLSCFTSLYIKSSLLAIKQSLQKLPPAFSYCRKKAGAPFQFRCSCFFLSFF